MLHKTHVDLAGDGEDALRVEAIVEPAVWVPDFPGDEPDMEYTSWRDLLFVYSEVSSDGGVSPAGGPVAGSANAAAPYAEA